MNNKWLVDGELVYRLKQIGMYGIEPIMENETTVHVSGMKHTSLEDRNALAQRICDFLNSEETHHAD